MDLTAGGSDRGPAMGGDGVVNRHSMPKVGSFFGPLLDEKKSEKGCAMHLDSSLCLVGLAEQPTCTLGIRKADRAEDSVESALHAQLLRDKSTTMASTSNAEYQVSSWEVDVYTFTGSPGRGILGEYSGE